MPAIAEAVVELVMGPGSLLVGRYMIEREIGRGGMSIVYLATDLSHNRAVAVKVLRSEVAAVIGAERFLREIDIVAHLTHPHILPLHDSGNAEGCVYYVMPYVEEESLRDRLRRELQLSLPDALQVAREIADALAYAHARGVVHRDIKPGNILLQSGHAVLADFGIAQAIAVAGTDPLTTTGLPVGTPQYMSPEQAGGKVDGRSDVYSLGCVLYEMLAGEPPFAGRTPQAILARHQHEAPSPIRVLRPGLPNAVVDAIETSLAKVPADRFPTARAFKAQLDLAATGPTRSPTATWALPRHFAALIAVAAVALVVVAFAARLTLNDSSPSPSGASIAVLPFDQPRGASETGSPLAAHVLFANVLDWVPGVRSVDGSSLVEPARTWTARPSPELLRAARRAGASYLAVGSVTGGARVTVAVYDVDDGEEVLRGADSASGSALDAPIGRLALQSGSALARREGLDLGSRAAIFAASRVPAAVGELLQAQSRFGRGDSDGAASALTAALEADSNCGLAYHRLSVVHAYRHDDVAAMAAVEAGLSRRDQLDKGALALLDAQRHYLTGYGRAAISAFQETVLDNRENIDAWFGLGEALFHFAAFVGQSPQDARSALTRVTVLDTALTPVYDHLFELALQANDRRAAELYLRRLPPDSPWRPMRGAMVTLYFGSADQRAAALARLRTMDRPFLSEAVMSAMHGGRRLGLADTIAGFLLGADRTPDDRRRGAQYRLVALAARGRWSEAVQAWKPAAAHYPFDAWMVQAALAGFPARNLVDPMYLWAKSQLAEGATSGLHRPVWDEVRQGFEALAQRAAVRGDSAEVLDLVRRIDRGPAPDPADPGPDAHRASLQARLALLASDTARAVALLERAVSRVAEPWTANYPLTSMAPQRFLLSELLEARGDGAAAARWRASFANSWSIVDALYLARFGDTAKLSAYTP